MTNKATSGRRGLVLVIIVCAVIAAWTGACWLKSLLESPGSAEAEPEPSACIALGSTTKFTNPVSTEVIYLKRMAPRWSVIGMKIRNTSIIPQTLITLGYQMKI